MKLRIGNTINIKFTITRAGTPYDLRDKNLLLVVKNKIKNTEVILHYPAFSITGADHNVIFWTFQGNEQVYTGKYMLTLYENKGLDNMLAVDCCDAFELVNYTCDTDNETSCGNVEVETIELAADVGVSIGSVNWGGIGGDISSQTDLKNALDGKVDKVEGKGLSTNDFDDTYKETLDNLDETTIINALANKVDKVEGKQLSDENYSLSEKQKLEGLSNYDDSGIVAELNNKVDKVEGKGLSKNDFTDELKNKLDNVESGAQKNVNADWNSSSGDSEIKNKPTLGTLAEKSGVDIADINATGTPSSSTTLHGDGTWKASGTGSVNWGGIGGDMSLQTDLTNALDGKVDNSRVLTDVPENAKFTDTVYTHPTTAGNKHIPTGGATGQYLKYSASGTAAWATPSKSDVGLANVDNVKQIPLSQKGSNNGVAELDASGKVPANQLPSFVDDVLEFANLASFPQSGEADKIYVDKATNKTYRWGGSGYVQLNEGVVLGETPTTAYRGDRGKIAYEHSLSNHAPADAQKNSDITKAEIEAKLTGAITSHTHSAYVPTSRTVAGKALTGNITLAKGDVGLGNVDNTSDASKPISTAQQAALDDKENITNKVQALSASSTHDQYPTAKCMYDMIGNLETLLAAI